MTIDDIETLLETFEILDDWEERYRTLIDLGKSVPVFPEVLRVPQHKVEGCMSQVWMVSSYDQQNRLNLLADSDALIVKGLIGVLLILFQGKTRDEISQIDTEDVFEGLGLNNHLSPNRRNGLIAMVNRITTTAAS